MAPRNSTVFTCSAPNNCINSAVADLVFASFLSPFYSSQVSEGNSCYKKKGLNINYLLLEKPQHRALLHPLAKRVKETMVPYTRPLCLRHDHYTRSSRALPFHPSIFFSHLSIVARFSMAVLVFFARETLPGWTPRDASSSAAG